MTHNVPAKIAAVILSMVLVTDVNAVPPALERILDEVPLADGLGPMERPWLGGWESTRPQLLDADGDADRDLLVFEGLGKLRLYRNDGPAGSPHFVFQTDEWGGGVHQLEFGRVVDIDLDNDLDLFVQAPDFATVIEGNTNFQPGAFLYTNVGTPTEPVFENLSAHPDGYVADDEGQPIAMVTTAPDFVDLEGDGDQDLLFGDVSGTIFLYRNVGSAASPVFHFETGQYDSLIIVFGACSPEFTGPIRLSDLLGSSGVGLRHGYMLFNFYDIDGNGLTDLFIGDQFNSNVYFLRNMGGSPNPSFQCESENFFPPNEKPGYGQFLVAAFSDLDADGDPDALLGSGNQVTTAITYLRNDGSPAFPSFSIQTLDYLPELDLAGQSIPAFADVDGGGVPDLYIGSGRNQELAFLNNYGVPDAPEFGLDDPSWLPISGAGWIAPEFADLDSDGDLDMFIGGADGAVRWWRKVGNPTESNFIEVTTDLAFGRPANRLINQRVEAQAVPRFFDDDGDGDLDLIVGPWDFQTNASLVYFRNDGTTRTPQMTFASSDWRGLGEFGQALAPAFGDVDGDLDSDLLVGTHDGRIMLFENSGTFVAPVFDGAPQFLGVDVGLDAAPFLVNLDGDGDLDLAVGENAGGMNLFRSSPSGPIPAAFALLEPAVSDSIDGQLPVRFDWEPSIDPVSGLECIYELRVAGMPDAPPREWIVVPGLTESEATIVIHQGYLRFRHKFFWTVVARGVRVAPIPEWRRGIHETFEEFYGDPDPPVTPDPVHRTPPSLAVRARPVPARETVRLEVDWPAAAAAAIDVFDIHGRLVTHLWQGAAVPGPRELTWNARDASGHPVAAGVYLVRVSQGRESVTKRVVILR